MRRAFSGACCSITHGSSFFCQSHDGVHFGVHIGEENYDNGCGIQGQHSFDGFLAVVLAVQIHVVRHGVCTCVHYVGKCMRGSSREVTDHIVVCAYALLL